MVLDLILAHCARTGSDTWTFHNRLWVREQLDELRGRGLITWEFDADANFKVTLTNELKPVPTYLLTGADELVMLGDGR